MTSVILLQIACFAGVSPAPELRNGAYHVYPGQSIQQALHFLQATSACLKVTQLLIGMSHVAIERAHDSGHGGKEVIWNNTIFKDTHSRNIEPKRPGELQ